MEVFVVERNSFRLIAEAVPCVEKKRNGMNSVLRHFSPAQPSSQNQVTRFSLAMKWQGERVRRARPIVGSSSPISAWSCSG
jgi:hypothetical protein